MKFTRLSKKLEKKLRKLQLNVLEVGGCINLPDNKIFVKKLISTVNSIQYNKCSPKYIPFHTHPTQQTPLGHEKYFRVPPSVADLIMNSINSFINKKPMMDVIVDQNGYYQIYPKNYHAIDQFYKLNELSQDDILHVASTGDWTFYTQEQNDKLQTYMNTIFTEENRTKYKTFQGVIDHYFGTLNYNIKYYEFK
jgi:hypothetical protein